MADPSNELDLDQAADRISQIRDLSIEGARDLLEAMVVRGRVMIIETWGKERREWRFDDVLRDSRERGGGRVQNYADMLPLTSEQRDARTMRFVMPGEDGDETVTEFFPIPRCYHVRSSEILAEIDSAVAPHANGHRPAARTGRKPYPTRDQCVAELAGGFNSSRLPDNQREIIEEIRRWLGKEGLGEGDDGFPGLTQLKDWAGLIKERVEIMRGKGL